MQQGKELKVVSDAGPFWTSHLQLGPRQIAAARLETGRQVWPQRSTHLWTKQSSAWCHTTGSCRSSLWNRMKWSTSPSICIGSRGFAAKW